MTGSNLFLGSSVRARAVHRIRIQVLQDLVKLFGSEPNCKFAEKLAQDQDWITLFDLF